MRGKYIISLRAVAIYNSKKKKKKKREIFNETITRIDKSNEKKSYSSQI